MHDDVITKVKQSEAPYWQFDSLLTEGLKTIKHKATVILNEDKTKTIKFDCFHMISSTNHVHKKCSNAPLWLLA